MKKDYIIVGQGIAGTFLSWFLSNRYGRKVLVIDKPVPTSSSRVAAGIFNPVTGRRFTKTWMAEQLFPFAETAYSALESHLHEHFYHPKNILRLFTSVKDRNDILSGPDDNTKFIRDHVQAGAFPELDNNFGGIELAPGGFVDVSRLISAYTRMLRDREEFLEKDFDHSQLEVSSSGLRYKGIEAGKLIFCEGWKGMNNPFFSDLPFAVTKGELLTVKIPGYTVDKIVSRGIFILPAGNGLYRVGATYSWQEYDETPTGKAREDLLQKLDKVLKVPFEVVDHKAGIRPTVRDRRPLIGIHPEQPAIGILNGLGTKGVLLGPYFASELAGHLEQGLPLTREADIRRFIP